MSIVANVHGLEEDEKIEAIVRAVDAAIGSVGFCVPLTHTETGERYLRKLEERGIVEVQRMAGPRAGEMTIEVARRSIQ